jgi:hypothetical protein
MAGNSPLTEAGKFKKEKRKPLAEGWPGARGSQAAGVFLAGE